jgi:hypothetical protein
MSGPLAAVGRVVMDAKIRELQSQVARARELACEARHAADRAENVLAKAQETVLELMVQAAKDRQPEAISRV